MIRAAVLLAAVVALAPATASAATARMDSTTVDTGKTGIVAIPVITVTGDPGERNDVTIAFANRELLPGGGGTITVTDATAPLTPGAGCARSGDAVVCAIARSYAYAAADLGDGDDRLTIDGPFTSVDAHGGAGADRLASGPASRSTLDGGEGDDTLVGGDGGDTLVGGPGADAISGGDGLFDHVSYAERTTGVTVRLGAGGPSGAPGEGDTIAPDVEGAYGGAGDDVLIGTPGRDHLTGNGGNDRVEGLGGDDDLRGDQGTGFAAPDADLVLGGDGDDDVATVGRGTRVEGGEGSDDITTIGPVTVDPGAGRDFVRALGGGATVATGASDGAVDLVRCVNGAALSVELGDGDFSDGCGRGVRQAHLRPFALLASSPSVWDRPSLVAGLDLTCADATRGGCAVRLSVRNVDTRRVLAAQRLTLAAGTHIPLRVTLPPKGVRKSDRFVDYVVSMRAPSGEVQTLRWHAWIPGGTATPTDGNGGRNAPIPPRLT